MNMETYVLLRQSESAVMNHIINMTRPGLELPEILRPKMANCLRHMEEESAMFPKNVYKQYIMTG